MIRAARSRHSAWLMIAGALLLGLQPKAGFALQSAAAAAPSGGAAAGPPAATPAPKPGPAPPKNLEPLPPGQYTGVLGKDVAGPDGKDLGPIVDVIVNVDGTPRAAVIDFGGFLGVGSRKIAVDWRLLNFAPDRTDGQIWLSLDRAEIAAAPEYKPDSSKDQMVGPPWAAAPVPSAGK